MTIGKNFFIIKLPSKSIIVQFTYKMKRRKKHHAASQSGQSLVEFVLLLAVVGTLSLSFIRVANNNIATNWETFARAIVEDPTQNDKLTID